MHVAAMSYARHERMRMNTNNANKQFLQASLNAYNKEPLCIGFNAKEPGRYKELIVINNNSKSYTVTKWSLSRPNRISVSIPSKAHRANSNLNAGRIQLC